MQQGQLCPPQMANANCVSSIVIQGKKRVGNIIFLAKGGEIGL